MGGRRRVAGDGSVAGRGRVGGTVCHRGLVINSRAEENISLRVAGEGGEAIEASYCLRSAQVSYHTKKINERNNKKATEVQFSSRVMEIRLDERNSNKNFRGIL